jgi:hypothetical protein
MKKLTVFFLLCFLLIGFNSFAQHDTWDLFAKVKFTSKFYKEFNDYFLAPKFDENIKNIEGKEVILKGHYLPFDLPNKLHIIISKFPYAQCFFCGGAGPESIAEVHFKEKPRKFKADEIIVVKGRLRLNDSDVNHVNFILEDAELVLKGPV